MPHAIAGVFEQTIAGIFTPGLVDGTQVINNLIASDRKQRTNDAGSTQIQLVVGILRVYICKAGMNPAQPSRTGSAQQTHEYSFRLVVLGMSCGNFVEHWQSAAFLWLKQRAEVLITQLASSRFHAQSVFARVCRHIALATQKTQPDFLCQLAHKSLIVIRFRTTNFMIEVHNHEYDSQFAAQFEQDPQQCNRVGAAGNRYTCTLTGFKEAVLADEFGNGFNH